MSKCSDIKFEKMLAEYDLDLLSPEDREAFELHVLACDSCAERVSQFAQESLHLLHSPKLKAVVQRALGDQDDFAADVPPARAKKHRRIISLVPLAAAVVLVFLTLKPWKVEIHTDDEALAAVNRLAVLPITNRSGEQDTSLVGLAATRLLMIDLSDSRTVSVVSSQHIEDILSTIAGSETAANEDRLATEVASESNSRWVFSGAIVQEPPNLTIDILLLDAAGDDTLAFRQVSCDPESDIFCVVDSITTTIRHRLLPLLDSVGTDRPVAEITTHSQDAYLHYVEGVEQYYKFFLDQAAASFTKATDLDSTFAMAWYYLALTDDQRYIENALRYLDRTSRRERYWISSRAALWSGDTAGYFDQLRQLISEYPDEEEAYYWMGIVENTRGELEQAEYYYLQAIKVNAHHKSSYNQLIYLYSTQGNYEQAIWAANRYIELVPDEPNPYDSRGDLYARFGEINLAIQSYREAVNIRPDFGATARKLASLLLLTGQFDEADHWLGGRATPIGELPSAGNVVSLTSVLIAQGLLDSASRYADYRLEELWRDYNGDDRLEIARSLMVQKALVRAETDPYQAAQDIQEAYQPGGNTVQSSGIDVYHYEIMLLAESRHPNEIERVLNKRQGEQARSGEMELLFQYASACIGLEEGAADSAATIFEALSRSERYAGDFLIAYLLSRSLVEANRMEEAVALLDSLLKVPAAGLIIFPMISVRLHYYLGVAYEQSGRPEEASAQYEKFLEYWGTADMELPIVNQVRQRLGRLKS